MASLSLGLVLFISLALRLKVVGLLRLAHRHSPWHGHVLVFLGESIRREVVVLLLILLHLRHIEWLLEVLLRRGHPSFAVET